MSLISSQPPREYRVTWKREGQPRKRKIYQTEAGAKHFMRYSLLDGEEAAPAEEQYQAISDAAWERMTAPFVEEPRLEVREVGEWAPVS